MDDTTKHKIVLALVGMPGAGKSEAAVFFERKGIPFVRFGELTDEGLRSIGLPITPENERMFREKLRQEHGMAAYAIMAKPKIQRLLEEHTAVVIDGMRSWEEYLLLKKEFPELKVIHIYAEPRVRYQRLQDRKERPVPLDKSKERDILELENLHMGGPIAIADYIVMNNSNRIEELYRQIEQLLTHLKIHDTP